jgi:hypothetical protein
MVSRRLGLSACAALLGACQPQPSASRAASGPVGADSLVLERGACLGRCPVYRVLLTAAGDVRFYSGAPGDSGGAPKVVAAVAPPAVARLVRQADAAGFFALPADIMRDRTLCPVVATDHPTVVLTIYRPTGAKAVADYLGCFTGRDSPAAARTALPPLRALQSAVDSVVSTGTRWTPPRDRGAP